MDSLMLTASMIATLIFSKAAEKGGEKLGEAVSSQISCLLNTIREKFKSKQIEGKLNEAQNNPSEKNISRFERELIEQIEDDETFANALRNLVNELKENEQVNMVFFKGVKVKGDAEIGCIDQTTARSGSVSYETVEDVEVEGNLKIGNVKQQG